MRDVMTVAEHPVGTKKTSQQGHLSKRKSAAQKAMNYLRRRQRATAGPGDTLEAILARGPRGGLNSRKTGQPAWYREMKVQAEARRLLSNAPLVAVDAISDRLAASLQAVGIRSVYALSQASIEQVLSADGVGTATARKIHKELTERNVPMKWVIK